MGKVVTSQGLTDFVQSGKFTQVTDHKPKGNGEATPLETVQPDKTVNLGDDPAKKPTESAKNDESAPKSAETGSKEPEKAVNEGLEPEDVDFPERVKQRINKKHREMMEAKELAEENERFAENQYNRARLAEERAAALEKELTETRAKTQPIVAPKEPELKEPQPEDFVVKGEMRWTKYKDADGKEHPGFLEAHSKYAAEKAVSEERARQAEESAKKERAELETRVKANVAKAREAHEDFDKVLEGASEINVPAHIQQYMVESELIGELGYYFAKNPEEFSRIAQMKPILAIAAIGKLEEKLVKPPAKAETAQTPAPRAGAPAPITPLSSGTAPVNTDPAKMTYKELREYERQRARKSRH